MRHILFSLSTLAALVCTTPAWAAYYGVLDNGEILTDGKLKLTPDFQVLTENGGLNLGGTFDMSIQDEYGLRALFGFGKTDYYGGAMFKWMPVPDMDNQPSIGGNIGVVYGKNGDTRDLTFRFEPLISKKIMVEQTVFTPYISLPVGIRVRNGSSYSENYPYEKESYQETDLTFQMVLGSQLQLEGLKNVQFLAEIGLNMDKAPGYISFAAVFYYDRENGFSIE